VNPVAIIASPPAPSAPPTAPKANGRSAGKEQSPFEQLILQAAAAPKQAKGNAKDKTPGKPAKADAESPALAVEVPVPVPPAPLKLKPLEGGDPDMGTEAAAENAAPEASAEQAPRTDVALQVRIRLAQGEALPLAGAPGSEAAVPHDNPAPRPLPAHIPVPSRDPASPSGAPAREGAAGVRPETDTDTEPEASPAHGISKIPVAAVKATLATHSRSSDTGSAPEPAPLTTGTAAHSAGATFAATSEIAGRQPETPAHAAPPQAPPPTPAHLPEPATAPQPLRSIALEFAPDGAADVRLRLSERAGEVHISLHSSDPSLTGRLHEGVHDLVGSLSNAGYEAEAWTPRHGRQHNQRQFVAPPKMRRHDPSGGANSFSLSQPIQAVS
jgi:hypothetical protein